MPPGIDEGINAEIELATIGDRTTPLRKLLVDGTERTAEKRKRELVRTKTLPSCSIKWPAARQEVKVNGE